MSKQFDELFDRVFSSRWNPFYRTGTIAISLLLILVATGFYLLFVYQLAAPYESMQAISKNQVHQLIRSIHRYSSDLCLFFVLIHALRMYLERKTSGPRALAWITGLFLLGLLLFLGWTGFVLVWDAHGAAIAQSGAELIQSLPVNTQAVSRAVSGAALVGTSFFFLNLFLHMSLPLGMFVLLWIHTSKLNKPKWFLSKAYFGWLLAALLAVSILIPAPLSEKADLLKLDDNYPLDIAYGFIIPLVNFFGSKISLAILIVAALFLFSIPFWRKPKEPVKKAIHNQSACTGCEQCTKDCPFNAIDMVPRAVGDGSDLVAFVDESLCVGCGICSASCSQLAIGPKDKTIHQQLKLVIDLKKKYCKDGTLFICCGESSLSKRFFEYSVANKNVAILKLSCIGNLHTSTVYFAANHFHSVYIISCAEHQCNQRIGQDLLEKRIFYGRDPVPPGPLNLEKIKIFSGSAGDEEIWYKLIGQAETFPKWRKLLKISMGSFIISWLTASSSGIKYIQNEASSVLRIALRIPSQSQKICKSRTVEEVKKMPAHMRASEECRKIAVDYNFKLLVDGEVTFDSIEKSSGFHSDKPIIIERDVRIQPGKHEIEIKLVPLLASTADLLTINDKSSNALNSGRVLLITYNSELKKIIYRKQAY